MSIAKTPATLGLVAALFALILAPTAFGPGPTSAQYALPVVLYGTAGLQDGDTVVAFADGEECGSSTVSAGFWQIPELYPGDCNGAGVPGATITFTVNGVRADQVLTWGQFGYTPPDAVAGITLTTGGTGPATLLPPGAPTLSRSSGLAIFDGGSINELEAAATARCPGGASIWVNEPSGNGYLPFVVQAGVGHIVNRPFTGAYRDGFDGPEPVIVTGCKS